MNVVVCDDERLYCDAVANAIAAWAKETSAEHAIIVRCFSSSEDLAEALQNGLFVDMLFLDIQIPGELSGLELAKQLRVTNSQAVIVFVTNYAEYACEGYSVDALRYLRKPIQQKQITECMNIAFRRWSLARSENIVINTRKSIVSLRYQDILYIEVAAHNLRFHTINRIDALETRGRLLDVVASLPSELFVRCHRSFLVNLMYVRQLSTNTLMMADATVIPLGRKYEASVAEAFDQFYQGMSL